MLNEKVALQPLGLANALLVIRVVLFRRHSGDPAIAGETRIGRAAFAHRAI